MTYQIVDNFAAGLDTRKSPLTSPPGSLTRLINAMISPGGEIGKRRAFVNIANVAGTFGLAATESAVYVFGRNVNPSLPSWPLPLIPLIGVNIPNSDATLQQTDFDIFDGKIYLACRTGSGALPVYPTAAQNPHYYDSNLTEGAGKGYYVRTFQSKMYSVCGKSLFFSAVGNPVVWDGDDNIGAVAVTKLDKTNPARCTVSSADIGGFTNGMMVLIAGATGTGLTAANGYHTIANVGSPANTFTLNGVNASSATAAQTSGVKATPAIYVTSISNSNPCVCTVNAADIGKFTTGMTVNIAYADAIGMSAVNGKHVISDVGSPVNTFTLAGVNTAAASAPDTSGAWLTLLSDVARTGRGSINLSLLDADSERLTSLEVYYDKLAVFSTQAIQVWAVDPDPAQNAFTQLLRGAGTSAPSSPLQYGNGDVLYLDASGIRSMKARDSSNSASVSDIGSPVDPEIRDMLLAKLQPYMDQSISLLEPSIGRFWMVFPTQILVLSYFPGPKITAWSVQTLPFTVTQAVTAGGRVFLRDTADNIYLYGGVDGVTYDNCGVEVRLPYLDGKKPGHKKMFKAFDATVSGTWRVAVSFNYDTPDTEETIATISKPTWNVGANELLGNDSHFSLRFYNNDDQPATISNCAIHYDMADDET